MNGEIIIAGYASAAVAVGGGVLVFERGQRERRLASWQERELRFGRDVSERSVVAVLEAVASLPFSTVVICEVRADASGIRHFISTDQAALDALSAQIRAALPAARLDPATPEDDSNPTLAARVHVVGRAPVLRQDAVEQSSAALLAAVQPLHHGEALLVRWLLSPGGRGQVTTSTETAPAHAKAWAAKNSGNVLNVSGVVAVTATSRGRGAHLLGRVGSVMRTRATTYGGVRQTRANARTLARRSVGRGVPLAPNELVGLLGWPIGSPALPGVKAGGAPVLIASPTVPRTGRVLGVATHPSSERPMAQPLEGALSHTLLAGPTGVGKSSLMTNLAVADMQAGRGLLLIDGKGDTARSVLERVPEHRQADVTVLDCASSGPLPGLRVFDGPEPELAADVALGVLSELFRDSWGPLSERYLRAALVAVAHDPDGTLADVPYVFSDDAYRRSLTGRLHDPLVLGVFAAFEAMSPGERANQLAAAFNKLGALLGRPAVRTILGQPDGGLDLTAVLESGRIVVVSLAPTRIGGPAARLIGALIVHRLFQATLARSDAPAASRTPFMVYLDEPRTLADTRLPLDALLEQARGLGVGLTLAPQSVRQLPLDLRDALLTNAASRVVFAQHADDARLLARDLPGVIADDLQALGRFEAVARIALRAGESAPPLSLRTLPMSPPTLNRAQVHAVTNATGQTTAQVDARLRQRHTPGRPDAPVGRSRRSS